MCRKRLVRTILKRRTGLRVPFEGRCRQMLDGNAHQLGQCADTEFALNLCCRIGDGLVADVQFLSDNIIGLALGDQRQRLQLPDGDRFQRIVYAAGVDERDFGSQFVTEVAAAIADALECLEEFI